VSLTACSTVLTTAPAPSATLSIGLQNTLTPITSTTPELTYTASPVQTATSQVEPFPTTPASSESTPAFGTNGIGPDFIFSGQSATCQLPCWHDLKVGISTFEDARRVFANVIGFRELPNLQDYPYVEGYHIAWNRWDLKAETSARGPEFFYFGSWFANSSKVLDAIELSGSSDQFEPYTSPAQVLKELGQPSQMLIAPVTLSEDPSSGGTSLLLIYQTGMVFYYSFAVHIENEPNHIGGNAKICLGDLPGVRGPYWVEAYIVKSIPDITELSPLQMKLFGSNIAARSFQSLESPTGVTLSQITSSAKEQTNPCVSVVAH